ncbi:GIY-YIG nuclease family protein [Candidatus Saccharibacteria bacterium]|nr:MAG: GIY-YIG nuclease family protein [Candidatus Saccharibacteria bacterium]
MNTYYVYILASKPNGTLYIGVTNNLERRLYEHKNTLADGFTKKYGVKQLVYYEEYNSVEAAIIREKQLKKWERAWKVRLIEERNSYWNDLSLEWGMDSRLRGNDSETVRIQS